MSIHQTWQQKTHQSQEMSVSQVAKLYLHSVSLSGPMTASGIGWKPDLHNTYTEQTTHFPMLNVRVMCFSHMTSNYKNRFQITN